MSNYAESLKDFDDCIAARVPVIVVRTIEQPRALRLIKEAINNPKRSQVPVWVHTRATGLRDLRTNASTTDDKSLVGATEFAAQQFTSRTGAVVVFVDPEDLSSDSSSSRHFAELARLAEASSGSVVVVGDTAVWSGLARLGMTVSLDLPNADEMYDVLYGMLSDHQGRVPIAWSEQDARRAAEYLVGITETEAVNLMAMTLSKGSVEASDVQELANRKDRSFSDLAGVERVKIDPDESSVGGLSNLRDWLQRRHELMTADLRGTHLRPPRGVLLVGVPGCGKSLSAKAIAAQWQMPLYRLDLAAVLGQYVGQSEGRLREALDTVDRVAPCVLWIDEIEKGLSGQDDSSGVGRRMIGQFLFWLQESHARVFVVATANNVRSLPPELLRKGRFDELFFVDLPDETDRAEMIAMYHRRYLGTEPSAQLLTELVRLSNGFAGADIASGLHDAGAEQHLSKAPVSEEFLIRTFANVMPLSRTNPEQIEEIRAWGRERAIPAGTSVVATTNGDAPGRRVLLVGD